VTLPKKRRPKRGGSTGSLVHMKPRKTEKKLLVDPGHKIKTGPKSKMKKTTSQTKWFEKGKKRKGHPGDRATTSSALTKAKTVEKKGEEARERKRRHLHDNPSIIR